MSTHELLFSPHLPSLLPFTPPSRRSPSLYLFLPSFPPPLCPLKARLSCNCTFTSTGHVFPISSVGRKAGGTGFSVLRQIPEHLSAFLLQSKTDEAVLHISDGGVLFTRLLVHGP